MREHDLSLYTNFIAGVVATGAAIYTQLRIYRGSKSIFAYLLIAFTYIVAIDYFIYVYNEWTLETVIADGQKTEETRFTTTSIGVYIYYLCSI